MTTIGPYRLRCICNSNKIVLKKANVSIPALAGTSPTATTQGNTRDIYHQPDVTENHHQRRLVTPIPVLTPAPETPSFDPVFVRRVFFDHSGSGRYQNHLSNKSLMPCWLIRTSCCSHKDWYFPSVPIFPMHFVRDFPHERRGGSAMTMIHSCLMTFMFADPGLGLSIL